MANLVPPTEEIARAKKPPKEHKMIMANLVPPTEEIARAKKPPKRHKMTVKTKFSKVTLNPKFSKASVKFLKKHYHSLQKKGRDFQKFLWGRKRN